MIDTNELRRKVNSTEIVDHIDLHANIRGFLPELLNRLEAAEKAVTEAYQRGYETAQEEVEKERDALRAELSKQQALTDAAQHIAEVAQSRANQLQAKIAEMERQELVGVLHVGSYYGEELQDWEFEADQRVCDRLNERHVTNPTSLNLYALPGAQPETRVPDGWQLVPTAESRHPGIYKMLGALHAADNTPGVSEWESYRAMLSEAPEAKP